MEQSIKSQPNNPKNKKINTLPSIIMFVAAIICLVFGVAVIFFKFSLFATVFSSVALIISAVVLAIVGFVVMRLQQRKLFLLQKEAQKEAELAKSAPSPMDFYAILGIPPQYKSDGSIKNIFELLQIEPVYDQNGVRVLTPYELLGINPKFTQDGIEVPSVVRIKNRINRVAKIKAATAPLILVPKDKLMGIDRLLPPDHQPNTEQEQKTQPQPNVMVLKKATNGAAKPKTKAQKPRLPSAAKEIKFKDNSGAKKSSGGGGNAGGGGNNKDAKKTSAFASFDANPHGGTNFDLKSFGLLTQKQQLAGKTNNLYVNKNESSVKTPTHESSKELLTEEENAGINDNSNSL